MYCSDFGWTIRVDAGAEGKWREPLYLRTLQALSRKGLDSKVKVRVLVHEEAKQWIVLPDMVVEDGYLLIVPMGTDQHGQTVWKPVRFNDAESMRRTYDLLYCGKRDLLVVLPFKANSNHLTSTWINQAFSDRRIAGSRSPQT
jgi:hypothetical protein